MNRYLPKICAGAVAAAAMAGCTEPSRRDIEVSIADLVEPHLTVQINQELPEPGQASLGEGARFTDPAIPTPGTVLTATLTYKNKLADGECLIVRGLEATVGSVAVAVTAGQWAYDILGDGRCYAPTFFVRVDDLAKNKGLDRRGAIVTMRDASRTLSAPLGDLLIQRAVEVVAPPSGGYRPGDELRLRWLPAQDLDSGMPLLSYEATTAESGGTIDPATIRRDGDTVVSRLPLSFQPIDKRMLHPRLQYAPQCSGTDCSLALRISASVPIRVAAP